MYKENPTRIFIVDDNKIFSHALKNDIETSFNKKNIVVDSFATGETCMMKFKEEKPQVVILDYHLNSQYPDAMDGIKVLDLIKKENVETNVIMLTAEDNVDVALKSFHHGASDYVVKTDSQFRKINYSLSNLFKMMEARNDAKRYKRLLIALFLLIALLIGGVIAIQIFAPSLLR